MADEETGAVVGLLVAEHVHPTAKIAWVVPFEVVAARYWLPLNAVMRSAASGEARQSAPVWPALAERQRLVEAVLRLPGIRDPERRERITRDVVAALGADVVNDLTDDRPATPYEMAWELVHASLVRPGGVQALANVLRGQFPDSREMVELEQLVRFLSPHRLLGPAERAALRSLLARVEPAELSAAIRLITPDPALSSDLEWAAADDAIDRLEVLTSTTDGPPPLLAFVASLAHAGLGLPKEDLQSWVDEVGSRLGYDSVALLRLNAETAVRSSVDQRYRLLVELSPSASTASPAERSTGTLASLARPSRSMPNWSARKNWSA